MSGKVVTSKLFDKRARQALGVVIAGRLILNYAIYQSAAAG